MFLGSWQRLKTPHGGGGFVSTTPQVFHWAHISKFYLVVHRWVVIKVAFAKLEFCKSFILRVLAKA
jgi:hypothetical protein